MYPNRMLTRALAALGFVALIGCGGETPTGDEHKIYFVGYVYDGATGARLTKAQVTAISLKYRDTVIPTEVEADGRFVTKAALPTWQDYAVYIGAAGYRPFVSHNSGVDVPESIAMTDGLVGAKTTQTFQMEARLFPIALQAPQVTLTIDQSDALASDVPLPRASGQVRFSPKSLSLLEERAQPAARPRRWLNDEDLHNKTITKAFTDGALEVAEGELVYGVAYDITVFGVAGYQPMQYPEPLVAGQVASRTLVLAKEQKDPLRLLATNADACLPPAGTSNAYEAAITLEFNEPVEFVNANAAEEIDNGLSITSSGTATFPNTYCALNGAGTAAAQERGSKVSIMGNKLTLSFNPSVGFNQTSQSSFSCVLPPSLARVTYGNLQSVVLRPVGDASRKKTLAELVNGLNGSSGGSFSTQLTCGSKQNQF